MSAEVLWLRGTALQYVTEPCAIRGQLSSAMLPPYVPIPKRGTR